MEDEEKDDDNYFEELLYDYFDDYYDESFQKFISEKRYNELNEKYIEAIDEAEYFYIYIEKKLKEQ